MQNGRHRLTQKHVPLKWILQLDLTTKGPDLKKKSQYQQDQVREGVFH